MPELIFHILIIGVPVLILLYCAVCLAALRPRTGTLEWISDCDRPAPPLLGHPCPTDKKDLLFLICLGVLTCLLRVSGMLQPLSEHFSSPPALLALFLLENVGAPMEAVILSFLLMKCLFGQTFSAALCAVLIAADMFVNPVSLAFSAASLFFLVWFLTIPGEAALRQTLIPLAGSFVSLAAGCYFDPALLLMLTAALLVCVLGCFERFTITGKLRLLPCLATALLSIVLTWIAIFIPAGIGTGSRFPSLLAGGGYYLMILRRLGDGFSALYGEGLRIARALYDWPLLMAAFPALVAAVVWLARERNHRCTLLLIWTVMQFLTLALLGSHAFSLSCALCLCQVWSRLERNRFLWLACVGAVALFTLLLAQQFLIVFGQEVLP